MTKCKVQWCSSERIRGSLPRGCGGKVCGVEIKGILRETREELKVAGRKDDKLHRRARSGWEKATGFKVKGKIRDV